MKRKLYRIWAIALGLILLFSLAACNDTPGKNPDEDENGGNNPPPPTAYTAIVKDQNGNAVENVWLQICYTENGSSKTAKNGKGKSDANGTVTFAQFEPTENIVYRIRIADFGTNESNRSLPSHYSSTSMFYAFDENNTAQVALTYDPASFDPLNVPQLTYSRVPGNSGPEETKQPLQLTVKANETSYFYFTPYVTPKTVSTDETNPETGEKYTEAEALTKTQEIINAAQTTASGKYEIGFTHTGSGKVTLARYLGSRSNLILNTDKPKPGKYVVLDETDSDAQTPTLKLHLQTSLVTAEHIFGITAAADGTVTVSAERTADALTPEKIDGTANIDLTNITEYGDYTGEDSLIDVPVNSGTEVVKNTDGTYRWGNEDGPVVHVQLQRPMVRLGEKSIKAWRENEVFDGSGKPIAMGDAAYRFTKQKMSDTEEGIVESVTSYNYTGLVDAYAAKVNADGVYPVNDDIKTFLQLFCEKSANSTTAPRDRLWLLACQMYGSSETPGTVTGTPVGLDDEITVTVEHTDNDGILYVFTPTETGLYSIEMQQIEGYAEITDIGWNLWWSNNEDKTTSDSILATKNEPLQFRVLCLLGSEVDTTVTFKVVFTKLKPYNENDSTTGYTIPNSNTPLSLMLDIAETGEHTFTFELPKLSSTATAVVSVTVNGQNESFTLEPSGTRSKTLTFTVSPDTKITVQAGSSVMLTIDAETA